MIKFIQGSKVTILDTEDKVLELFDSDGDIKTKYEESHTFVVLYPVAALHRCQTKANKLLSYLMMIARRAEWSFIFVAPSIDRLDKRLRLYFSARRKLTLEDGKKTRK